MGIKPLYIARRGEDLYFGSELKAILVHPEIERSVEPGRSGLLSVAELRARAVDPGGGNRETAARDIGWSGGAARSGRNATGSLPFRPAKSAGRPRRRKQELDRLLKQSVREHLVVRCATGCLAQRRLGFVHLVHYAAEASAARVSRRFRLSFRGRSFDETRYVARSGASAMAPNTPNSI